MKSLLALTFVTLLIATKYYNAFGNEQILYVKVASNEISCHNENQALCQPLEFYLGNVSAWFSSNTVMVFTEGNHSLGSTVKVSDSHGFTMTGWGNASHDNKGLPQPTSWINCNDGSSGGIHFMHSSEIHIHNLGFRNCGGNIVSIRGYDISAALSFSLVDNVSIKQVVTYYAANFGIYTQDICGSNDVSDSAFLHTIKQSRTDSGNAKFSFENECKLGNSSLVVNSSWFMHGGKKGFYKAAGGLSVYINCSGVRVTITNITSRNNFGDNSGNVALFLTTADSSIVVDRSQIVDGKATKGGGLRFWYKQNQSYATSVCSRRISHVLNISNTHFEGNLVRQTGGAMYVAYYNNSTLSDYDCLIRQITIRNCSFIRNGGNGAAMEIILHSLTHHRLMPLFQTVIEGSTFKENFLPSKVDGPVIDLISVDVTVINCSFIGSNMTVISLRNTYLNLYGSSKFENNTAEIGGALKVCEASLIFGHNGTSVAFNNNRAKKGGAIYIQEVCKDTFPLCFFQPSVPKGTHVTQFSNLFHFTFSNNSAEIAGDNLYGGDIDQCSTIIPYTWNASRHYSKYWYFKKIFTMIFVIKNRGPSWISSNARRVCFCNKTHVYNYTSCITKRYPLEKYPGEKFMVSVITVGQMNGSTLGIINISLEDQKQPSHSLVRLGTDTESKAECINLTFIVYSNRTSARINFRPITSNKAIRRYMQSVLSLTINLLQCPFGFKLTDIHPYECNCHPLFSIYQDLSPVLCNISNQVLSVYQRRIWIGCLEKKQYTNSNKLPTCNTTVVSYDCGYYCAKAFRTMRISDTDSQCLPGHTGMLCGACKPGFSRILGGRPECRRNCSYTKFPFLFIFFLASGILLVAFIRGLNLTVTEGTLNGLLFYTMIIQSHGFFPENPSTFGKFCWMIISWINLSLGIEACFYTSMDGYQQVWISYALIFYLILIQMLIIYISRKSVLFMRILGRNAVKILATIFMLVYSNLASTTLIALHYAKLYTSAPNHSFNSQLVWYFDGNISYLGPKHAPLFVVALLCSIVTLFLVFSLLLNQCLQKRSNLYCLHWVVKFRPFYEAYTGPCHDSYRFWPGFLILMRTGLYTMNSSFVADTGSTAQIKMLITAAMCIVIISLAIIFPHGVYKRWPINILEFSFLLNLCITSCFLGITQDRHLKNKALYTSVSVSVLTFLGILIYHIQSQVWKLHCLKKVVENASKKTRKLLVFGRNRKQQKSEDNVNKLETFLLPQDFPPVVQFDRYREPLMEL